MREVFVVLSAVRGGRWEGVADEGQRVGEGSQVAVNRVSMGFELLPDCLASAR